jgi:hypothetical protein
MPCIDYADPRQVFNRLAQIQHDTKKRIDTINALTLAQAEADREFDQIEQVALAYLEPKDDPVVMATAYDEQRYIRHSVEYCLTIINGTVTVKPYLHACDISDLTEEEITAALRNSERGRATTSGQDQATPIQP